MEEQIGGTGSTSCLEDWWWACPQGRPPTMAVYGTAPDFPRPPQFPIPVQLASVELAQGWTCDPMPCLWLMKPQHLATAWLQGLSQGLHTFCCQGKQPHSRKSRLLQMMPSSSWCPGFSTCCHTLHRGDTARIQQSEFPDRCTLLT